MRNLPSVTATWLTAPVQDSTELADGLEGEAKNTKGVARMNTFCCIRKSVQEIWPKEQPSWKHMYHRSVDGIYLFVLLCFALMLSGVRLGNNFEQMQKHRQGLVQQFLLRDKQLVGRICCLRNKDENREKKERKLWPLPCNASVVHILSSHLSFSLTQQTNTHSISK